ncbi:MAG: MBL fold metallo-hydrolase [Deltaproteobacteria bacterium]|nr:MBL fold metallo-hydrolase [Deltaproteobacteria bacterium]
MTPATPTKMYVTFWGTRGSISTPGRTTEKYGGNTPCVFVQYQDTNIIFDAGTGIRGLGLQLAEQLEDKKDNLSLHLFLSHTHWDHIQGLPFFEAAYIKGTELVIYGSSKKGRFLESILKRQMDVDYFPLGLSEMAAEIKIREISEETISLGSVVVDWQEQIFHPGGSVRYRLTAGGKRVAYATDVELDRMFGPGLKDANSDGALRDYLDFIQGVDLLIADGQYTEEEYPEKMDWGHTSIPVILELAEKADVKQLAIFHHDPQHSDKILDSLWHECHAGTGDSESRMNVFWAREGMTLAI